MLIERKQHLELQIVTVHAYAGDWLIVQLIYALARLAIPSRWRYPLALAVLIFAYAVEVAQFLAAGSIPQNIATELTIGSTFDLGDLIAYTLGVATALLTERLWKPERGSPVNG
ncbi:MAG TPA: DUF2809 domain-containing protein [Phototrophicaceae bacterium]|nr:DUF2809 domain-containing protein [Phototrophicaceae bacterium]